MLGFTRNEQRFIVFLVVCLLLGSGIRFYQNRWAPLPKTDRKLSVRESLEEEPVSITDGTTGNSMILKIDINQAGMDDLTSLPGIGPALAKRIWEYRQKNGSFSRVDVLLKVKGIGPKKLNKIRNYIIVH